MLPGEALVLGLVLVLVVLLASAFFWYHRTGWTTFSFQGTTPYDPSAGARRTPAWGASGGEKIDSLRFKGCLFTVEDPAGQVHAADVTSVLNGMAVAYRGARSKAPAVLALDRPLNPFSFQIPGVNDAATVPTPAQAAAWVDSKTTLTGSFRTI